MKAIVPFKNKLKQSLFLLSFLAAGFAAKTQSQTSNELIFENSSLYSGTAGADAAVYRFPSVNNDLDALIKIKGRSSALVTLANIDIPSTGHKKAFQPHIVYNNGSVNGALDWWMEFEFSFVNKGTTTPATINNFQFTALDIDGNNNQLREWDAFYGANSYILEGVSQLAVSNLIGTLSQVLLGGKKFTGSLTDYPGIDTTVTSIMSTLYYQNTNTFTMRVGGTTTGSTNGASRMSSVWFKSFSYNTPALTTLPVVLKHFSATLKNEIVSLKWEAEKEENFSHYILQRSYNGNQYEDIATVFGNSQSGFMKYSYTDASVNSQKGIAYYRLLMVDKDGKAKYSEIKLIRFGRQKESLTILTYPNPVSNEVRVTIPNSWQGKEVRFDIFNSNGQLVRTVRNSFASQTETIAVNNLAKGFYVVKAGNGIETAQQSIIKN